MSCVCRRNVTNVLGGEDMHFNYFHRWFDVIFVVTAWTTIGVGFIQKQLSQDTHAHLVDVKMQ